MPEGTFTISIITIRYLSYSLCKFFSMLDWILSRSKVVIEFQFYETAYSEVNLILQMVASPQDSCPLIGLIRTEVININDNWILKYILMQSKQYSLPFCGFFYPGKNIYIQRLSTLFVKNLLILRERPLIKVLSFIYFGLYNSVTTLLMGCRV